MNKKGFNLIELFVAITILCILGTIAFKSMERYRTGYIQQSQEEV
jgi:prepilin-type N-terminal cleavage/methylation domain-containing protein